MWQVGKLGVMMVNQERVLLLLFLFVGVLGACAEGEEVAVNTAVPTPPPTIEPTVTETAVPAELVLKFEDSTVQSRRRGSAYLRRCRATARRVRLLQSDKLIYTNRGLLPPTIVRILGLILILLGILAAGFFVFAAIYTKEWWVALLSVAAVIIFMMPIAAMNTIEVWLKNDTLVYKEIPFDFFPAKSVPLHSIQDVFVETERIRAQTVFFITVQHFDRSVTNFGSGRSREEIAEVVERIRENLPGTQQFQQAMSWMDDENYFEAIRLLTKILANNPQNVEAWLFIGMAKWQMGEPKRALGDFNKCIELDSQNAVAYMQRALLHYKLGFWEHSLADLEAHLVLLPGAADHPKVKKMKEDLKQKIGLFD